MPSDHPYRGITPERKPYPLALPLCSEPANFLHTMAWFPYGSLLDFLRILVACFQCDSGYGHRLTESCHNTGNILGRYRMNDQRKTKKQLLEDLQRERELVGRERERSVALQEVSSKLTLHSVFIARL